MIMNKIIVSGWAAPLYCTLEMYLNNGDKIVLSYKETKELPKEVKSEEGNRYCPVIEGEQIIGFQQLLKEEK